MALALAAAGCGGSSSPAGSSPAAQASGTTLVSQTFGAAAAVRSGVLHLDLTVTPTGSSTITGPISIGFGGPFQSSGAGRPPASNLTITLAGFGKRGSLGLISTGTAGFVTLGGTAYQLPAATYAKLASGLGGSGVGPLGRLGIDPRGWLANPRVVGVEPVDGTPSTHVTAGVDVPRLLDGLNSIVARAGTLGGGGVAPTLSAAERAKIAAAVRSPRVDIWSGVRDHALRRLTVTMRIPVTGQTSALLGGMREAAVRLTFGYSQINQPQTVTAPASARPFAEFQAKLAQVIGSLGGTGLLGSVAGAAGGAAGLGTASGTGGSGAASGAGSAQISAYGQCIQSAGGDVTKMQRCAALLTTK